MSGILNITGRQVVDERAAKRVAAARRYLLEIPREDLEVLDERRGLAVDRGSGELFERFEALVDGATADGSVRAFTLEDSDVVYLARPAAGRPQTLTKLEERQVATQAQQEREKADHAAFIERQELLPVTLAQIYGDPARPTLRKAAELIIGVGGKIEAKDGALRILLPARISEFGPTEEEARKPIYKACAVLHDGQGHRPAPTGAAESQAAGRAATRCPTRRRRRPHVNHHYLIPAAPNRTVSGTGPAPPQMRATADRARSTDRAIRVLAMRLYAERLQQHARLRRLGIRTPRPKHYTEDIRYRQATRRLAEKANPPASRGAGADKPRTIRRLSGHVFAVR